MRTAPGRTSAALRPRPEEGLACVGSRPAVPLAPRHGPVRASRKLHLVPPLGEARFLSAREHFGNTLTHLRAEARPGLRRRRYAVELRLQ